MVFLECQDQPESLNVSLRKLTIPRFGALRRNQSLLLEEAQLGRAEIAEFALQAFEHVTDAEEPCAIVRSGGFR